jgi:tetratricopeptide (TPR) repeat protein
MRPAFVGGVSLLVLALAFCPASLAQGPAGDADWDRCVKAPTRACILDEALLRALSIGPTASRQFGEIAEAQASAGNLQTALRIAHSIPSNQRPRVTALRSIARAQASVGLANEAKATFIEAHQLAAALVDQLDGAEALLSIAQAEAETGMAAEATFAESLQRAEAVKMRAGPTCEISRLPERQLDSLLKALAQQQAMSGNISEALRIARSIRYDPIIRAEALRAIGEVQARSGGQSEAGQILKEAMEAARAAQMPRENWPSCPGMRFVTSPESYAEALCMISEAQAKTGRTEDAASTLELALQSIPAIKDDALWKAEVSRSLVLSAIAEAQSEVGLKPQSEATFERAAQMASEVREPKHRVMALTRLARARYKARETDAAGTFDDALALARGLEKSFERADGLLGVVQAKADLGLTNDAIPILIQALAATRSIPDKFARVLLLQRIAKAQQNAGRLQDGAATYTEALDALDTAEDVQGRSQRANSLFMLIRSWPGQPQDTKLIALTASQMVRIADSINEKWRPEALVLIAKALPN